jgi:hypothetical protein
MNEEFQFNNLIFEKPQKDNSFDIYSQFKSYDMTGINDYKNKTTFKPKNLLISTKSSINQFHNENKKKEQKLNINFIKSLIKKPDAMLYDGYLCRRKKPTINYLLNKTKSKENKKIIEENLLFKHPYPLLKYLSNRKLKNKSRFLITGILGAEFNDLSLEQKKEIEYKPDKSLIKLSKKKYPIINKFSNNITSNNSRDYLKTEESLSTSTIASRKKTYYKNNNKHNIKELNLNKFLHNFSEDKKLIDERRKILIYNLNKFKLYNNSIKLKEHSTMVDNITFLRKSEKKKNENKTMSHILKDISILKYKKHIMPINI